MTPGPLLAFTVNSAAKRGSSVGFLIVLGHAIIESTLVITIFVGAATFLTDKTLLRVIGGVGAAVLAAMGVMMLRGLKNLSFSAILSGTSTPSKVEHPLLGGIPLTAVNPTFPVWWAGLGLGLVTTYGTSVANVAVFYAGHITADLVWYLFISLAVGHGRRFISDRTYRLFIGACALFLVWLALTFARNAAFDA